MIERLPVPADAVVALRDAGLDASPWSAGPQAHFAVHTHAHTKRLYVVRGSIRFNEEWLQAPAGIRIPAGVEHSALVGDGGVDCVEGFE
jgi:hypothetical protein